MELITKNNYELVNKSQFDYRDKKTGEMKKGHLLYLTDLTTGIQEQLFVNEETFNNAKLKDKGQIVYDYNGKGTYYKGINLVKN